MCRKGRFSQRRSHITIYHTAMALLASTHFILTRYNSSCGYRLITSSHGLLRLINFSLDHVIPRMLLILWLFENYKISVGRNFLLYPILLVSSTHPYNWKTETITFILLLLLFSITVKLNKVKAIYRGYYKWGGMIISGESLTVKYLSYKYQVIASIWWCWTSISSFDI